MSKTDDVNTTVLTSEPTARDRELAERICRAIITQFGPGLTDGDRAFFVASHLAAERSAEREHCLKIIRHYLTAHQRSARLAKEQLAIAGHGAAAASLETVLERIVNVCNDAGN